MLPPTILTEAIAQVGAILILAKPENREKLPYFMGIERVRYRRPVHPGDVVEIEAMVRRLRSRMGVLRGIARVDGQVVVEGTMTFALGPRTEGAGRSYAATSSTDADLRRRARPTPPTARRGRSSATYRDTAGARTIAPIQARRSRDASAMPRVSRSRARLRERRDRSTSPTSRR